MDFVLGLEGLHDAVFHGPFAAARPLTPGGDAAARIATLVEMGVKAGAFADVDPEPSARLVFAMLHETVDAISEGRDRKRMVSALKLMLRRSLGQRSA